VVGLGEDDAAEGAQVAELGQREHAAADGLDDGEEVVVAGAVRVARRVDGAVERAVVPAGVVAAHVLGPLAQHGVEVPPRRKALLALRVDDLDVAAAEAGAHFVLVLPWHARLDDLVDDFGVDREDARVVIEAR
jgi:hypothetical protein